jgi:hypothetical protein
MPARQNSIPPSERERFRRWLSKLSARVEDALDDRDNRDAAMEVRAMLLAALAAVGSMDRRAKMTAERRGRQLDKTIQALKALRSSSAKS